MAVRRGGCARTHASRRSTCIPGSSPAACQIEEVRRVTIALFHVVVRHLRVQRPSEESASGQYVDPRKEGLSGPAGVSSTPHDHAALGPDRARGWVPVSVSPCNPGNLRRPIGRQQPLVVHCPCGIRITPAGPDRTYSSGKRTHGMAILDLPMGELLTVTRAVRTRLDRSRPVEPEEILAGYFNQGGFAALPRPRRGPILGSAPA